MAGRLSVVPGAILFACGAIGAAIWLWVKRRQLAVAAAKAVPGQVGAIKAEQPPSVP